MVTRNQAKQTALLIDNDPALRVEVTQCLQALGFEVLEAKDSNTGIRDFRDRRPFIVFVDLLIPIDDAADLLTAISKDAPDTPVVLISANGEVPDELRDIQLDAFDCLSRPITATAVEHAVRHSQFQSKLLEASRAHIRYLERRNVQLDVRLHELEKLSTQLQGELQTKTPNTEKPSNNQALDTDEASQLRAIRSALEGAADSFLITDQAGVAVYANAAFETSFGTPYAPDGPFRLGDLFLNPGVADTMKDNVETLGTFSCEVPMVSKTGQEFHALVRATAIGDESSPEKGRLYIFSDITEQEQFRQQAYHDALTGLNSRRHFMELLQQNVSLARRHAHPLSLCLCDLDNFKSVNDTHGHQVGDDVLETFGRVISEEIRAEDIPGRLGGDEFCLLFPYVPANVAAICLERVRKKFAAITFTTEAGETFSVTATFGIVDLPTGGATEEELLELADQSLYQAKELGRNCAVANGAPYK